MNIYLCGMIGAGKTALGKALATRLSWKFFDLDETMDREAGCRFHELVAREGWLSFRQREYRICKRFAHGHHAVIALGGGTVRYEWNMDVLRGTGYTILLTADLPTLAERVRQNDRPRVNEGTTLEEDLIQIWSQWNHLYYEAADAVYATDQGKDIAEEAEDLVKIVTALVPESDRTWDA
jgi:shikimate kinase